MRDLLREFAVSIIGGLVVAVIVELVGGEGLESASLPGIVDNTLGRFSLVAALAFIIIFGVIKGIKQRRQSLRDANRSAFWTITEPPEHAYLDGTIEKFGVLWEGEYGVRRTGPFTDISDAYTYVDGPVCPHDEHEVVPRTVSHWFVFTRKAWVCTHCDREYPRPVRHYGNEYDVVESEMKKMFEEAVEEELESRP